MPPFRLEKRTHIEITLSPPPIIIMTEIIKHKACQIEDWLIWWKNAIIWGCASAHCNKIEQA
jgi:hypothetical protein